jgi:hypothetical protein
MSDDERMSTAREQSDFAGGDDTDAVEQVVEEVRDEIRHGQVEDDVSSVLEDRLTEAGVELRPETIDGLAEDIENDVSL